MDTSLLTTIILMVLIVAISVGLWSRHHRIRPIIGGVGLALVPLGLYLLGVTDLAVGGIMSIIDWAQRTVWDDVMTWGAALGGAGLLLFVIAQFLPKGPRSDRPAQPQAGGSKARPQVTGAKPQPQQGAQPQGKAAPKGKDGLSDEDREIEELLRRRGIG